LPLLALLPPAGYVPDFITAPPRSPLDRIEDELERVRATAPEQVAKELDIFAWQHGNQLPATAAPLRRNPRREVPRLVETMALYWTRAVEPFWPRLLALLSADLRYRATRLTQGGPESLFDDLHPTVTLDGDWLRIDQPWQGTVELGGRGLLLVPMAFSWQRPVDHLGRAVAADAALPSARRGVAVGVSARSPSGAIRADRRDSCADPCRTRRAAVHD